MKPEDVKVAESASIQIKINDKVAEMEDIKSQLQEKAAELQKLVAKQSHARADEFRNDINAQREAIAKGHSPKLALGRMVGPLPEHN